MSKKTFFSSLVILSILTLSSCAFNKKLVKGDKNIVTKEYAITHYTKLDVGVPSEVYYTLNDSLDAYLSLEVDNNIIEYLDIEVNNEKLSIREIDKISIKPSKFIIRTNSKELYALAMYGNVKFISNEKLKTSDLKIDIAGSGEVTCNDLEANSTYVSIAGSGKITLAGKSPNTAYKIAGSGNISTLNLLQDSVTCHIAGSGFIEVNAKDILTNKIAGSGKITYKGNPKINNSIAGSGKIEQID